MPDPNARGRPQPEAGRLPGDVVHRPLAWDRLSRLQAIRECRDRPVVIVVRQGTCEHASWLDESSPYLRATRALDPSGIGFYKRRAAPQAVLHGLATLQPSEAVAPPPLEPLSSEPPVETTWVEIAMVDDADAPVADEECRIELPDGTVRTGRLNWVGTARLNGIPKGTCKVSFPRLDSDAWENA